MTTLTDGGYLLESGHKGHPRADKSRRVRQHILVAERALGKPLPIAAIVHHHNEIKTDNRNSNLVICEDRRYHVLIHQRMLVIAAGGDPNTQKQCPKCKALYSFSEFYPRKWRTGSGLASKCKTCSISVARERRTHIVRWRGKGRRLDLAVIDAMKTGLCTTRDIAARIGVSVVQITNSMPRLQKRGSVKRVGQREWALT